MSNIGFRFISIWLPNVVACAGAMCISLILCRLFMVLSPKLGLVDKPKNEAHKNHQKATPVAGGISMLISWLLTLLLGIWIVMLVSGNSSLLSQFPRLSDFRYGIGHRASELAVFLAGATALAVVGLMDDYQAMSAKKKFFLQFVFAAFTATYGPRLTFFCNFTPLTWLVTTLWIMTVINAMNFFDNMDGLAGGTAAIATVFFAIIAIIRGQFLVSGLAAVTCGCVLGFLWYNKPPAKIFMGDGGSHFLGYCLAILAILTTFYVPGESPTPAPVIIPLFILAIPLFDAVAVVIIRLRLKKPIYVGDNRHISHRFVNLGLTRPQAVLLVTLLSLLAGTAALTLLWLPPLGIILIALQLAAMLTIVSIIQFYTAK